MTSKFSIACTVKKQINLPLLGCYSLYRAKKHTSTSPQVRNVKILPIITCESPIDLSYFRSNHGHANICSYCCGEGEEKRKILQQFKTVIPIRESCTLQGKDYTVSSLAKGFRSSLLPINPWKISLRKIGDDLLFLIGCNCE